MKIIITGFSAQQMTLEAEETLSKAERIVFHTARCGCAERLERDGVPFESLDGIYEQTEDFDEHIAQALELLEADSGENTVFCVMDTRDETAKAYLAKHPRTRVLGGGVNAALELLAGPALCSVSAQSLAEAAVSPRNSLLVDEIDNRILAGEVKLRLEEIYGDEAAIWVRMPQGDVISLPLENLDRLKSYDHRCACLVNPRGSVTELASYDFESLLRLSAETGAEAGSAEGEALAEEIARCAVKLNGLTAYGDYTAGEVFAMAADAIKNHERK